MGLGQQLRHTNEASATCSHFITATGWNAKMQEAVMQEAVMGLGVYVCMWFLVHGFKNMSIVYLESSRNRYLYTSVHLVNKIK